METKQKLLMKVLNGEKISRPPFWLMRQAGRYLPEYRKIRSTTENFLDFCYNPELSVEAALQPLRRYQFDAAILFSDILVIPDALGQKVVFRAGEGPILDPIKSENDLKLLSLRKFHNHLDRVYETVSILSKKIPKETTLIGFSGSPWTLATYMVEGKGSKDFSKARIWAYYDPINFEKLINILTEAVSIYIIKQIDYGAEVIQLFDTWAGILSGSQFDSWVIKPTRNIIKNVRSVYPKVPILGFPRGAGVSYKSFVEKTGVSGISLDSSVPVEWASINLQTKCAVQGNLDNMALVAGGEMMEIEVHNILKGFSSGSHIFNLGHGILPQTPPENVKKLSDIILNWQK